MKQYNPIRGGSPVSKIREQDPLKQGLKHFGSAVGDFREIIREQDPLKQGLKLLRKHMPKQHCSAIREQDPLKQGLKLRSSCKGRVHKAIREQEPQKQGLKHEDLEKT